ncbi:PREDICTED: putative 1-phosphatidylinositol-3-phosphate 5-kinase FAB1D [Populus euphratica]|uniref:1-phosphatidylinositol-3-phosphate 5-kinase n=1 Tax=Populus euphratica TaxID=75702 RepID=A0AAJ6Y119_POPEU|nr:PREDICTED: putative 1-phosphatidylinositol-3-phosphate 5-kinase FAB1D [Populus euphratica]XP_011038184.1 PREDICTED: putative 1-phosphatidylinositol-3-phosphate 5-kinase FAB1D [Populus euphratica]XP_011038185.1 PREDICTED: putative 1-phosphatidylinositol-3-phosphate 5-kinase FAB1D [Populus euphratica]XP_011038186.1 PREDICTED: putative 1-phosphatidylinositol-3-phosphate 5-kinase FAB1D [Populus euphratica]XP_011038187.1 PREDICTED: putative 1-phosphatidylinositol-3-phosphate 5-kinase FAB1D [Popul
MCHYCGADQAKLKDEKQKLENGDSLKLNGEEPIWSCQFCQEKQEPKNHDGLSHSMSPMTSPTTSLSISDRSISSCSDLSVDVNLHDRAHQEEGTVHSAQKDLGYAVNDQQHNTTLEAPVNRVDGLHKVMEKDSHNGSDRDTVRDVEIVELVHNQESKGNSSVNRVGSSNEGNNISQISDDKVDAWVWEPPEAEDPEDDLDGGVAFIDDDEECGDGTKWGKPSSLSCWRGEGSRSFKFKEEKRKAMEEVVNGKFKAIVSQLLKAVGVACVVRDGESWVDIVTSLSWEAASFLKPEAVDGKAMDLDGYVKVKCIATGSRSESQVVEGLVFKKNAAHKHMPTKYKNPRLLLIRGVLGHSSSVLSSFKSMEQERDNLKSLVETIEMCHPNVVLVEKSVSRDVQESILAKGMTLVYDMKLHRLKRVARCTGSPILSSDALISQKLKHCDSFHIEKFVEEHAGVGEGGKKPSKTLMFIEGCPTHLGCTILLKGSHSDELKRVKYVTQLAVVIAYHLILETSFLVDWKAMFSSAVFAGAASNSSRDLQSSVLGTSIPSVEESTTETGSSTIDIPICNGFHEEGFHNINIGLEGYNPAIFSGFSSLSASLKKVAGDSMPLVSSSPYQSLSNYFGFNGKEINGQISEEVPVLKTVEASDLYDMEDKKGSDKEKTVHDGHPQSLFSYSEASLDRVKDVNYNEDQIQSQGDVNAVLDSQSILVLMSRRNALRGTVCEQSHFSHIMFYKNFDVPLGKFLRDNLLNQSSQCNTCGELPEAHFYYYAHHNEQLTIQVKRLLKILPGEAEGKLWMWIRCGKCKHESKFPKSTKRVLISTAACSLSFGKFLELSFSHQFSSGILFSCGHSLERDFLFFFGLGPLAAMFKYSPVTTYTLSLPPQKLEFHPTIRPDGPEQEFHDVYLRGMLLFNGVGETLKNLRSRFAGSVLNLHGSLKEFSDIEDMLKQESSEFEKAVVKNRDEAAYKLLSLNQLLWELLLESCIWERRLQSLLSPDPSVLVTGAGEEEVQDLFELQMTGTADGRNHANDTSSDKVYENSGNLRDTLSTTVRASEFSIKEIPVDGHVHESREHDSLYSSPTEAEDIERSRVTRLSQNRFFNQELFVKPSDSAHQHSDDGNCQADYFSDIQVERTIPIATSIGMSDSLVDSDSSKKGTSACSLAFSLENSNGWFWMPFSEIRRIYMKNLQRGFMPKFQPISSYIQEHVSAAYQLIMEEGQRLHIPVGTDNYMVRDYDGELSSIIACALAFLEDQPVSTELYNEDGRKEGGMSFKSTDSLDILTRIPTMISPHWSSNGSDSDPVHSKLNISLEESRLSSFDGLNLLESVVPPANLSLEVPLAVSKSFGKGKYSVICLYAKQFRDLRNRCCPSELDYIASISRCKNWDAKGGKSRSFFAKTLDDRFIIKEIKKTEFESFVKFAPHYFKYMIESFELGNQTCLAKVLGIYQVITRQTKSGKEIKHDLMVMENLTFGRKMTRQYDLKGALHARYNSAADGAGDVLLDKNFVDDMNSSPLYVSNASKYLLERAVWNDTTFLNSINVMDYSLLVGVDTQQRELVCGIIDYLRQYTWDKQLETWVKSSLVVPKNVLPTVISPIEYKKRFRKFMTAHFLSVPDNWCSQSSSNPSELCAAGDDGSSESKSQKQGHNGHTH